MHLFYFISEAYDKVIRRALFDKLTSIGLGGKTRTIIQNLYHNDCISIEVNGEFCKKIFLSNGVKQGDYKKNNNEFISFKSIFWVDS